MKTDIMYIECKENGMSNPGKICRVTFSKSGKTIIHGGLRLKSLKGAYKANYYNENTGFHYWVSRPKKDGTDSLYPQKVSIEPIIAKEYWMDVRNQPENKDKLWYKSPGKYKK